MKKYLLLLISVLTIGFTSFSQHGQFGIYIPVDIPDKNIMPKMGTNTGFGFSGAYSPFFTSRMFFEIKASWGMYSSKTLQQTYMFGNGTQTTTNVSYTSAMHKYLLGSKIMLNGDYRTVRAFITPQIGVTKFKTKIVIADPEDEDDCKPLDRETTQRFAGFVYGGEIGAEVFLHKIFKKIDSESQTKFFLSANYLGGFKHFEYVNIRYMEDGLHGTDETHESGDIKTNFINVSTDEIHEHKIAELYHTPLQMFGFNIGVIFNF